MYGISNSQQQGGGGGSAASYKAIKATLTPNDWQEVVGVTPFFVGENAMTWAVNNTGYEHEKSQTTSIGLVSGNSYTITAVCDGQTYTQTAVAEGDEVDGIRISYDLSPEADMYVDIYDDYDELVATGARCAIDVVATSFVITKFEGEGFGTTIQATIADSAIKVNSAVTMYTNTSEKVAVGEKTNGNVTLIAPSVPETAISYSLEIVGTDTEGLFELINGYVPEIPDTPGGVPQWNTIYEDTTGAAQVELSEPLQAGGLYRVTVSGEVYIFCPPFSADASTTNNFSINTDVFQNTTAMGHLTYNFGYRITWLRLDYIAQYTITADGVSNISFADNTDTQVRKITKVEVYR